MFKMPLKALEPNDVRFVVMITCGPWHPDKKDWCKRRATAASEDQNETWYRFLLTGIPRNKDFAITYLVYRCKKCGC